MAGANYQTGRTDQRLVEHNCLAIGYRPKRQPYYS
jgi:hypothetical protein